MRPPPAPPRQPKLRHRLSALLAMFVLLSTAGIWLISSNAGLRCSAALLTRASGGAITLTGIQGRLLGKLHVQTFTLKRSGLNISASDVELDWRPAALLHGKLELTRLTARTVEIISAKSPLPTDLRPPLAFTIEHLAIASLRTFSAAGGTANISTTELTASLNSDGNRYVLKALNTRLEYSRLSASGDMAATHPYALRGHATVLGQEEFIGSHNKAANIIVTASGNLLHLSIDARGSGAGLSGTAQAQLAPYEIFPLAALRLQVQGLDPHAFAPAAPQAKLTLQAELRAAVDGALAGEVQLRNDAPAAYDQGGLPLLTASAHATLSADLVKIDALQVRFNGGATISGTTAWQRRLATGSADLTIHRLNPAALDTRLRSAQLNGSMRLSGDSQVQRGMFTLGDGKLQLEAKLLKSADTLTLQRLSLTRGQAALSAQGELQLSARQAYRFNAALAHVDLAEFFPRAPRSELNTRLTLAGALKPQISGALNFLMQDSRVAKQTVSGSGQIEFSDGTHGKGMAELRLGDNLLSIKGGIGNVRDVLQLDLNAPVLAQLGAGYGGKLTAHAELSANLVRAKLTAEGHDILLPSGDQLASFNTDASLNNATLALSLQANDYRIDTQTVLRSLQLTLHGNMAQHELSATAQLKNNQQILLHARGGLSVAAQLGDTQWHGSLTELSGTGALPFNLNSATSVTLSKEYIALAAAELSVAGGKVSLKRNEWTPHHWRSRGSFTGIGLRFAQLAQTKRIASEAQEALRLGGTWDISSAAQLTGDLHLFRESGDLRLSGTPPFALGLEKLQLTARASGRKINAELSATGQRMGKLDANITLPLMRSGSVWQVAATSPLSGNVSLIATDLAWLGAATEGELLSSGQLTLTAQLSGTRRVPRLLGKIHGESLQLAWLDQGIRLEQGLLNAHFDQQTLHIDTLSFAAPHDAQPRDALLAGLVVAATPGSLTASGDISLNGSGDMAISVSRVPLTQRTDRWIIVSGNGHARLEKATLRLDGSLTADAGLIRQPVIAPPQLSDDVIITTQQQHASPAQHDFAMDANLDLGEHFFLRASGLEARLTGRLQVQENPRHSLRITGSIAAHEASFEAYGQHLTLERGIVNFTGSIYDPGLNLLALRKGLSVEAGVTVTGTARHPVVRLVSTPNVPDSEKLAWIVLGRPPDASGSDISLLLAAAEGVVGGGASGITGKLKQTIGVDQFSLRANDNNALNSQPLNEDPLSNQVAVVGKRLSARAFLSYEQRVTATAGVTKLTYRLTPKINIVTQAGFDNAIDIFYTFSFE